MAPYSYIEAAEMASAHAGDWRDYPTFYAWADVAIRYAKTLLANGHIDANVAEQIENKIRFWAWERTWQKEEEHLWL